MWPVRRKRERALVVIVPRAQRLVAHFVSNYNAPKSHRYFGWGDVVRHGGCSLSAYLELTTNTWIWKEKFRAYLRILSADDCTTYVWAGYTRGITLNIRQNKLFANIAVRKTK